MTKKPTLRIFLIAITIVFVGLFLFSPVIQKQIFNSGVSTVYAIGAPAGAAMGGTKEAKIDDILNAPLPIVGAVVKEVLLILSSVVGLLIPVAAGIVGFAMQINLDLLQPSANVAVSVGWNIFRQITNLGFVLGIIIIAIATILRSRSYRAQQILWKLVAAALLVNFSLVIAGSFLSVSDVFSKYFLTAFTGKTYASPNNTIAKITGGAVVISAQNNEIIKIVMGDLVDFSGAANMMSPDKNRGTNTGFLNYLANAKIFGGFSFNDIIGKNATVSIILSQIIQLVLFIIIFLAFIVLAGQIFIRYFYVTALLIVSPIVYLAWVFPFGQKWWREWWNHFIKWTFMLPLNLFFLWLAVRMLIGVKDATSKMADSMITSTTGGGAIFTGVTSFSALMGSIMAVAFIILGMKLAHKIGISTADTSVKWASSAGGYVKDKAGEYGKRAGARALVQTGAMGAVQTGLTKFGSTTIGRTLGIGKVAQRFAVAGAGVEKKTQAFIEEKRKSFDKLNSKQLAAMLPTMSAEERAAALETLTSRGDFSEATGKLSLNDMASTAKRMRDLGRGKQLSDLQKQFGMSIEMMDDLASGRTGDEFKAHAAEFYDKFSSDDWKKAASGIGNAAFDVEKLVPGMNSVQSGAFRSAYFNGLAGDFGQAIGATAPKLKRKQMREFYKQIINSALTTGKLGTKEVEVTSEEEYERPAGFGQVTKEKRTVTKKEMVDLDLKAQEAIKKGDIDEIVQIVEMSGNEDAKRMVQKLKKSIGSPAFTGETEEGKKEKATEEPKPKEEKK